MSFLEKRLGHAYLLSGPRGCGKTTAARLLAKLVNCERPSPEGEPCGECAPCRAVVSGEHLDVMEIDGASNRGIEQIRELKSHVSLAPFMGGRKIYILDEAHMLTQEAFNALLKTLEEPPPPVLFLFATTEPHKVPVTIRSRCQHVPFHRISADDIVERLRFVAGQEGFEAEASALWEIARNADGALRDALSLAEQALALGGGALTMDAAQNLLGGGTRGELEKWVTLLRHDPAEGSALLKNMLKRGVSPENFLDALFPLLRDMWVYSLWGSRSFAGLSLSDEEKAFLAEEAPLWTTERLKRACAACSSLFPRARWGMRSDTFAGLLLLELLGKEGKPDVRQPDGPYGEQTRTPPARPQAKGEDEKAKGEANAAPRVVSDEPPPVTAGGGIPKVFEALWQDELPLCAAMLDVSITVTDGALAVDYSRASAPARAVLESPRAQLALARAFGVEKARENPGGGAPDAVIAASAPAQPKRRKEADTSAMSLAELTAYLGGELLVEKPVDSGDLEDISEI